MAILSECCLLQCQAEIPGASTTKDCRDEGQVQHPKERAGTSQTASDGGSREMDPWMWVTKVNL